MIPAQEACPALSQSAPAAGSALPPPAPQLQAAETGAAAKSGIMDDDSQAALASRAVLPVKEGCPRASQISSALSSGLSCSPGRSLFLTRHQLRRRLLGLHIRRMLQHAVQGSILLEQRSSRLGTNPRHPRHIVCSLGPGQGTAGRRGAMPSCVGASLGWFSRQHAAQARPACLRQPLSWAAPPPLAPPEASPASASTSTNWCGCSPNSCTTGRQEDGLNR